MREYTRSHNQRTAPERIGRQPHISNFATQTVSMEGEKMYLYNESDELSGNSFSNANTDGARSVLIAFDSLPQTLEEFASLTTARMVSPFDTAAMLIAALCNYPYNKSESIAMVNYLKGPSPLAPWEETFIANRLRDKDYLPTSYFIGAAPHNGYAPSAPYMVMVTDDGPDSYTEDNTATLYLQSGGADSPCEVQLQRADDDKWYLIAYKLLPEIRAPELRNS